MDGSMEKNLGVEMNTPILETKRLILRPGKISDAQNVYNNWATDNDVVRFMRWNAHESVDVTVAWLSDAEKNIGDSESFDWLFVLKEINQPIGSGGMFYNDKHDMFEIGYCIMKKYWGLGIVTEATSKIIDFAKNSIKATELFACVAKENPASGRVLEKLGFVYKNDGQYSSFDGCRTHESYEYFYKG
jgi:ribosomal-protein-alanine N-acetyltransferase